MSPIKDKNKEPIGSNQTESTKEATAPKQEPTVCRHVFVSGGDVVVCKICGFRISSDDATTICSLLNKKIDADFGKLSELSMEINSNLKPVFDKIHNQNRMMQRIRDLECTNKDLSTENDQLEKEIADLKEQIHKKDSNLCELKHNQSGSEQSYNDVIGEFVEFISKFYGDLQVVSTVDDLKNRTKFEKLFRSLSKYGITIQYHERGTKVDVSQISDPIDDHPTPTGNKIDDNKVISCNFGYKIGTTMIKRESLSYYKYDWKMDNNLPEITVTLHCCDPPEVLTKQYKECFELPLPDDGN